MKSKNEYQQRIDPAFYETCPKAVLAAIAVSLLNRLDPTEKLDYTSCLHLEWATLHDNGIVPQKPEKWKDYVRKYRK